MQRIRDFVELIREPWQRLGWGRKFTTATGILTDQTIEAARIASRSALLATADSPNDALAPVGSEQRMPRYPTETDAMYRARLLRAWPAYLSAGSEPGLVARIQELGYIQDTPTTPGLDTWLPSAATWASGAVGPEGDADAFVLTPSATVTWHYVIAPLSPLMTATPGNRVRATFNYLAPNGIVDKLDVRIQNGGLDRCTATLQTFGTYEVDSQSNFRLVTCHDIGGGWCEVGVDWTFSTGDRLYLAPHGGTGNWGNGAGYTFRAHGLALAWDEVNIISQLRIASPPPSDWWSRFWVVVPPDLHGYVGSVPSEDLHTIRSVIAKWKPGKWRCEGIVFVVRGRLAHWPLDGATTTELAESGYTPASHEAITVSAT